MIDATTADFVSVNEAAKRLHVSHPTVWRWIKSGRLPAYRVGPKTIRVKLADLDRVVRPATVAREDMTSMTQPVPIDANSEHVPVLTPGQREAALAVLAEIDALQETMLEENGGVPFSSSIEIIRQMRQERSDALDQR